MDSPLPNTRAQLLQLLKSTIQNCTDNNEGNLSTPDFLNTGYRPLPFQKGRQGTTDAPLPPRIHLSGYFCCIGTLPKSLKKMEV